MQNSKHIKERVENVKNFIEPNFNKEISIEQITAIAFYSYRNINRIYKSVYQESIGAFIQRLRIEDAAKKVLYSDKSITEIGFESGYSDLQAFNKAFKSVYRQSPRNFRKLSERKLKTFEMSNENKRTDTELDFEIETFPALRCLYVSCIGVHNPATIETHWEDIIEFAVSRGLLSDDTQYIGEILDDEEITPKQKCRYNCLISLPENMEVGPSAFPKVKTIPSQKYATFLFKGNYQAIESFYRLIYTEWLFNNPYEIEDKPVLEVYLNDPTEVAPDDFLTKICIPVL